MTEVALVLLLLALSFLTRTIFILHGSSDEWMTYWVMRQQRARGFHYEAANSLIEGEFCYPPGLYYGISRFPESLWGLVGNLSNVTFDVLSVLITYGAAWAAFSSLGIDQRVLGASPAFWAALLYSTMPLLHPTSGRLNGIKGRTFGGLLSLLYFLCLGLAFLGEHPWAYVAAILLSLVSLYSSAFGMQNIALLSAWLSIFYVDWIPIAVFLGSVAIGVSIPKAGILPILRFKREHFRWLLSNYESTVAGGRNRLRSLLRLPATLVRKPREFLSQIFNKLTPVILLHSAPAVFILAGFWIADPGDFGRLFDDTPTRYAMAIVLGTVLVVVLTSIRPLLILGQSERYFEYAGPFLSFALVALVWSDPETSDFLPALVLFQLAMILFAFCTVMIPAFARAIRIFSVNDHAEIIEFLENMDPPPRVLTIPVKYGWALASQLHGTPASFYLMFVTGPEGGFDYMNRDLLRYDVPRTDLVYFCRAYGIDTLVVQKGDLDSLSKQGIEYPLADRNRIFDNDSFTIYTLTDTETSPRQPTEPLEDPER